MNNDLSLHGILSSGGSDAAGNNAAGHNSIYRGKDLTNLYSVTEICDRIANGTFNDLYVGDYFDITISTSFTSNEAVRCVIAGFNYYYYRGLDMTNRNHAVIVPRNCFTQKTGMNGSNTTEGGYYNSEVHKTKLPVYLSAIESVFGGSHVIEFDDSLTTEVDTTKAPDGYIDKMGRSSAISNYEIKIRLMNEVQVYGCKVASSSLYDISSSGSQLPLFALSPEMIIAGESGTSEPSSSEIYFYWLSSVLSSETFVSSGLRGPSYNGGSMTNYGLRPIWIIG